MQLILENGYPYPLPEGFDPDTYDCRNYCVKFDGVRHFEWKYVLTVEFKDFFSAKAVSEATGWPFWQVDKTRPILVVPFSADDGYEAPAIILKDMAYCGFILVEDEA